MKYSRPDSDKYYSYTGMQTLWDDSKCKLSLFNDFMTATFIYKKLIMPDVCVQTYKCHILKHLF